MSEPTDWTRYLYEKFRAGLESLATNPEPIKVRLEDAYVSQLMRGERPGADLPDELRDRIARFHERMTAVEDITRAVGTVAATVAAMSEQDAVDLAHEVVAIEYGLREAGADKW